MSKIIDLKCRDIIDSRGNPTVETCLVTTDGVSISSVPSGASKGIHEACELRDGGQKYHGKGVTKAVENVLEIIKPAILGQDCRNQGQVDKTMLKLDGTSNKSKLGANAILSVSLCCARAASLFYKIPLYLYIKSLYGYNGEIKQVSPMFNIINGGLHGNKNLSIQEFLINPTRSLSYVDSLEAGVTIYQDLKIYLKILNLSLSVGDEGGFTPEIKSNDEALDILTKVISSSKPFSEKINLSLDLASSTYFKNNSYAFIQDKTPFKSSKYLKFLYNMVSKYKIYSIEDPLSEDDWSNWRKITDKIGKKCIIVGDDLLVTNPFRLKKAISEKSCNAILVKVNQIGTLTETLEVISLAQKAGFKVIISHRSAETNDDFIADLAVGVVSDYVKFGAPARGERIAKYNRLKSIYEELKISN